MTPTNAPITAPAIAPPDEEEAVATVLVLVTQALAEVAFACTVHVPGGHDWQDVDEFEPITDDQVPATQDWHVLDEFAPRIVDQTPERHG